MKIADYARRYVDYTAGLLRRGDRAHAMSDAVGGEFEKIGKIEFALLRHLGLKPEHRLIDVGCGSGRLAFQLRGFLGDGYLGIDVVPAMLDYAREICARPQWRFEPAPGLAIPEPDASADWVVFFSVLTHLLHEDAYVYLQDARRVLKPGGRIVFSYLDFSQASHWHIFDGMVKSRGGDGLVNQFIGRDAIEAWAAHLGLRIAHLWPGDTPQFPLAEPISLSDGSQISGHATLGQSVCVLTLP